MAPRALAYSIAAVAAAAAASALAASSETGEGTWPQVALSAAPQQAPPSQPPAPPPRSGNDKAPLPPPLPNGFPADFMAEHEADAEVHVKPRSRDSDCPVPAGRWLHTATAIAGQVFVFGGVDAEALRAYGAHWAARPDGDAVHSVDDEAALLNDIWSYSLATSYWREAVPDTQGCSHRVLDPVARAAAESHLPMYRPASLPDPPPMRPPPSLEMERRAALAVPAGPGSSRTAAAPRPLPAATALAAAVYDTAPLLAPITAPLQVANLAAAIAARNDAAVAAENAGFAIPSPPPSAPFYRRPPGMDDTTDAGGKAGKPGKAGQPKPGSGTPGTPAKSPGKQLPPSQQLLLLQLDEHRRAAYREVLGLQLGAMVPAVDVGDGDVAMLEVAAGAGASETRGSSDALLSHQVHAGSEKRRHHRALRATTPLQGVTWGTSGDFARRVRAHAADAVNEAGHPRWLYSGDGETVIAPAAVAGQRPPPAQVVAARHVVYTPFDALWQWDLATQRWHQPASAPRPVVKVPATLLQSGALQAMLREGYTLPAPGGAPAGAASPAAAPATAPGSKTPAKSSSKQGTAPATGAASGATSGDDSLRFSRLPPEIVAPSDAAAAAGAPASGQSTPATASGGNPKLRKTPRTPAASSASAPSHATTGARVVDPDLDYPALLPPPRPLSAPAPRFLHTAVSMARGLLVFGGVSVHDLRVIGDMWHFDPEPPQHMPRGADVLTPADVAAAGSAPPGAPGTPPGPGKTSAPSRTTPATPGKTTGAPDAVAAASTPPLPLSREARGWLWTRVWPLPVSSSDAPTTSGSAITRSGASDASLPGIIDPVGPFYPGGSAPGRAPVDATAEARIPPPLEGHTAVVVRFPATAIPSRNLPRRPGDSSPEPPPPALPASVAVDALPPAGTSPDGSGEIMLVYGGLRADLGPGSAPFAAAGLVYAFSLYPTPDWDAHYPPKPDPNVMQPIVAVAPPQRWLHAATVVRLPTVLAASPASTTTTNPAPAGAGKKAPQSATTPNAGAGGSGGGAAAASGYEDVMLIFGGCGTDMRPLSDVWIYRYASNTWRQLMPHGYGPAPRWLAAIASVRPPPLPLHTLRGSAPLAPRGSYYATMETEPHPETVGTPERIERDARKAQAVEMARAAKEQAAALDQAVALADAQSKAPPQSGDKTAKTAPPGTPGKTPGKQRFAERQGVDGEFPTLGGMVAGLKSAAGKLTSGLSSLFRRKPATNDNKLTVSPVPIPSPATAAALSQDEAVTSVYDALTDEEPEALPPGEWDNGASAQYIQLRRAMGLESPSFSEDQWRAIAAQAAHYRSTQPTAMDEWRAIYAPPTSSAGGKPGASSKKPGLLSKIASKVKSLLGKGPAQPSGPSPLSLEDDVGDEPPKTAAATGKGGSKGAAAKPASKGSAGKRTLLLELGSEVHSEAQGSGVDDAAAAASASRLAAYAAASVNAGDAMGYDAFPDAAYGSDAEGAGTAVYVRGGSTANGVVFSDHYLLHIYPMAPDGATTGSSGKPGVTTPTKGKGKPASGGGASASALPPLPRLLCVWEELLDMTSGPMAREGAAAVVLTSDPRQSGIDEYAGGVAAALIKLREETRRAAWTPKDPVEPEGEAPAEASADAATAKAPPQSPGKATPKAGIKGQLLLEMEADVVGGGNEDGESGGDDAGAKAKPVTTTAAAPVAGDDADADVQLLRSAKGAEAILAATGAVPPMRYDFAPYPQPFAQWVLLVGGTQRSVPVRLAAAQRPAAVPLSVRLDAAGAALDAEELMVTSGTIASANGGSQDDGSSGSGGVDE